MQWVYLTCFVWDIKNLICFIIYCLACRVVMVYMGTATGCWVQCWQHCAVQLYVSGPHFLFSVVSWMLLTHLLRDSWAHQTMQGYQWCQLWTDITIQFLWSTWATEVRLGITESMFSHCLDFSIHFVCPVACCVQYPRHKGW